MTDLTDGYHYAIVFDKERIIEKKKGLPIPYCDGFCCQTYQYLAKVPTYEEWQSMDRLEKIMLQERGRLNKQVIELLEENTKLKELLKECKQWFDWYHIDTGTGKEYIESWYKKGHEIHQKINQVLGEDK